VARRSLAVSTRRISKRYGAITALNGFNINMSRGVFGLIGPNGAGKTTLLHILLGLTRPDSGEGEVLGISIISDSENIRKRTGVLHEKPSYPKTMTVEDYLDKVAKIYDSYESPNNILQEVGLSDAINRHIGKLSAGMLQRLGLAQALIGHSELVFLDEPTSNLDVVGRDELIRLIISLHREFGTSFMISSHVLSELERACHNVAFIKQGQIIEEGPVPEIIRKFASSTFRIVTSDTDRLIKQMADIDGLVGQSVSGANTITFSAKDRSIAEIESDIELVASKAGIQVYAVEPVRTLEEAFKVIMR
jgi:ABC-type multidrug transport system ATPase subunit